MALAPSTSARRYRGNIPNPQLLSRIAPQFPEMSARSKLWILAACALVVAQATASLVLRQGFTLTAFSDITQFVLLLSGTLALLPNALVARGRTRLFWALMTLGVAFWLVYQLLWMYFEIYLRQDVPNPFAGDVVLFLHIVPMMAAAALQPHIEPDDRTTRFGSLDFTLLLVWWLYLYLFAVIPWQYAHTNEALYEHSLNAIYLAEKLVFLAVVALLWLRSRGRWKIIYAHWFGASLTYALSSYLANWAIERNLYYSGSLYDIPVVASMAWLTGVGVLARDLSPCPEANHRSRTHGVWVARMAMIAIVSLPVFATWSLFDNAQPERVRTYRLALTLGSMLCMGAMVFLKQHLLDHELLGLLKRSQKSFEDLRRLQSQLVQSEKLASLGQLVGGAAHELNNPLTAMLGYSELLSTTSLNHEQRALADKIGQQVRQTKSLIASLIRFAKQAPGKTSVDLNGLIRTAVKLSETQLSAAEVRLQLDLDSSLPHISADSNQLLQVFLHIINHALEQLEPPNSTIKIRTTTEHNLAVLEFSPAVTGLQTPKKDDLFQSSGSGAGLGLTICCSAIQEHSGRLICSNQSSGPAALRIELPTEVKTKNPDSTRRASESSGGAHRLPTALA
jgi:signal transduction histidine kinase